MFVRCLYSGSLFSRHLSVLGPPNGAALLSLFQIAVSCQRTRPIILLSFSSAMDCSLFGVLYAVPAFVLATGAASPDCPHRMPADSRRRRRSSIFPARPKLQPARPDSRH